MPRSTHFLQSVELLEAILQGTAPSAAPRRRGRSGATDVSAVEIMPASKRMEIYFRAHRAMGVRDRGEVAETVYACLRNKRLLEHIAESNHPAALVAAQYLRDGMSARALEEAGFRGDARALAARVRTLDLTALRFAVRSSLPDWLAERLLAQYGETEALALAEALNRAAPVDLRTN